MWCYAAGRPLSAKQLLTSNNVSQPVAAEALYAALDDLMARAGALTAERRYSPASLPVSESKWALVDRGAVVLSANGLIFLPAVNMNGRPCFCSVAAAAIPPASRKVLPADALLTVPSGSG